MMFFSSSERSRKLWHEHKKGWVLILMLLMGSTFLIKQTTYLQMSILTTPEHAAFDGTTYPIAQVPDWLNTTSTEQKLTYPELSSDKLVDIPSYEPSRLRTDTSSLEWGDTYDDYTREMKLTYPVVYAGTYEMDWIEGAGSHPAVDIKAMRGTPVYAVMNGVVDKTVHSDSGYGNLVVLRHNDVPSLENENATTTLYSGYAHLDTILVADGDVVTKGQQIGTVGDTGTATTYHLHFQMDNSDAPWHLYWPFTTTESNAVGGFWEAVNQGVGLDNVYAYTVNPIDYVQTYLNAGTVLTNTDTLGTETTLIEISTNDDSTDVDDDLTTSTTDPISTTTTTTISGNDDYTPPFYAIGVDAPETMAIRTQSEVNVSLQDERGELVRTATFNSPIEVSISDPDVLTIFPDELSWPMFTTGETTLTISGQQSGTATLTFSFLGKDFAFTEIAVSPESQTLDSFGIETDGGFYINTPTSVAVVALNAEGERILTVDTTDPIYVEVIQGEGDLARSVLTASDFENGIATVAFTPTAGDNFMLKISYRDSTKTSGLLSGALFKDISDNNVYYDAIRYLKKTGVIQGYPDSTFRSDSPVSRVEALKMLFVALNKETVSDTMLHFPDTESGTWYAPYVATAQRDGIIQGYPDGTFKPTNEVNRVEFIKMLTLAMGTDVDPVVAENPYDDINYLEWYAPYAQFVKETNIAPWDSDTLAPSDSMTRGEVAEMLYRMLAIKNNKAESYSRVLVME